MGFTDNFRSTHDNKEILRILQKASSEQENIIWQTHALGRSIIQVQHMEIDFVSREVVIYFDSLHFHLEYELPLYVKLEYRSTVFKVEKYQKGANSIQFSLPKDVKTLELRSLKRHHFSEESPQVVSLQPTSSGKEHTHEIQVKVVDISEAGMGILISDHNRIFLKNNRILWVGRVGNAILPHPLLAEVVYINQDVEAKYQSKKGKNFKVGLKLSSQFPSEIYNSLIQ